MKTLLRFSLVVAITSLAGLAHASPSFYGYWDSAVPDTVSLHVTAPSSVCMWSGVGGQFGDTIDNDNLWLGQTTGWYSGGTWEFGGSGTNGEGCGGGTGCGYQVRWQQVTCTNPGAFHGAGFDHLYVSQQAGFDAFYHTTPVLYEPPWLPNTGKWYCGVTALGGDFTAGGSSANSADTDYAPNVAFLLYNDNAYPSSQNRMGAWCFQFQDVYNRPIVPHTDTMYVATPGYSPDLPNSSTAFCFLIYASGPMNHTADYQQVINPHDGISDQRLVVTTPGAAVVDCVDYDLAN